MDYRALFVGADVQVPVLGGGTAQYVNFDNAASTPPLKSVHQSVTAFMNYYSSVHRGTGFKSQLATHAYEEARRVVTEFVGADPATHVCIFGKNTTEALNKLARRFPFTAERDVVVSSGMEHHSNDLPWRYAVTPALAQPTPCTVVHVALRPDGGLDMEDFERALQQYKDRVALVSISGGSNVTGFIQPIHELAEQAHAVGAHIAVDCAQLAPHRAVEMLSLDDPAHLDYAAISAHKMYAPYGTGALVGRRDTFERGTPDMVGGGTIDIVTLDSVDWAAPPDRDEAGSPNTVGAVALAAALTQLSAIGMEAVAAHEIELTAYALEKFAAMPEVHLFGDADPANAASRLGVLPFNLNGLNHFLVSAVLGYEFGVGVRNGCFCAHPLIFHLHGLDKEEIEQVRRQMLNHNKASMPGMVRASFGLYNTTDEIDTFVDALNCIVKGEYRGEYVQDVESGEYAPKGWQPDFEQYFSLKAPVPAA
jgi:selenocysteine lyase/cysteine desulfurase